MSSLPIFADQVVFVCLYGQARRVRAHTPARPWVKLKYVRRRRGQAVVSNKQDAFSDAPFKPVVGVSVQSIHGDVLLTGLREPAPQVCLFHTRHVFRSDKAGERSPVTLPKERFGS